MRKKIYRILATTLSVAMFMQSTLVYAEPENGINITYDQTEEEILQPHEEALLPVEEFLQPGEGESQPIDENTQPGPAGEEPGEESVQPGEGESQPIDENTQPGPVGEEPGEENVQPGEEKSQPIGEITQPDPAGEEPGNEEIIPQDESIAPQTPGMSYMTIEPNAEGEIHLQNTEDFVALSNTAADVYQNATLVITRASGENFDLVGTEFTGLGTVEYPFKGKLVVTNGDSNDIRIPLDCSFFNYLDQSAEIGAGLFLQAGEDSVTPILAANFVNVDAVGTASHITVKIDSDVKDEEDGLTYSFAGMIGTMAEGTKLELGIENKASALLLQLRSEGDLGLFCNTMLSGSQLTISSVEGSSNLVMTTTNGHAGGVVGFMDEGTVLNIDAELSLTGIVKTAGADKAAGGLVGKAYNASISLNQPVTVDETVYAVGASAAGGYVGEAKYSTGDVSLNLNNYKMQTATIIGGVHSGGLFGVLQYAGKGTFTVQNIDITVSHSDVSTQFGGVAGIYTSDALTAELYISGSNVRITESGTVTSEGGYIGMVGDATSQGAIEGAAPSYINIEDCTACVDSVATNNGGLIGEMGARGHFLNVSGIIQILNNNGSFGGTNVGGLVGIARSGVIRISGETDLSGLVFDKAGAKYGQIVGARGLDNAVGTLVYALGIGNGDGNANYGWKFVRPSVPVAVSDTGYYGDVIRLDGVELTENVCSGAYVDPANKDSATEVLSYYTDRHQVVPCMKISTATKEIIIQNKRDFLVASIMYQHGKYDKNDLGKSAFYWFGPVGNDLLGYKITITGITELDLKDTGVVGLLQDNGNQTYTGIFEGNNCTIKMATGQTFGYGIEEESATVGQGQLYNHEAIGLLGVMSGSIRNLVLDGTIDFGMTTGGVNVSCGTIAARVQTTTVENVTVKTDIAYHVGDSAGTSPLSYVGGFFGYTPSASKTVNLTNCSLQSNIVNTCSSFTYYLGGFIGYCNQNSTIINITDCDITNAVLKAEASADAMMGAVIAYIDNSGHSHTLNVNGLQINGLQVENQATKTSGGLLGYCWRGTSFICEGLTISNSQLDTTCNFGGLVFEGSGYWKIGDGAGNSGIVFENNNTFVGSSSESSPSALLLAWAREDYSKVSTNAAYVEIMKEGLQIKENAVDVTLSSGEQFFDDLVGYTKFGDGTNAIVSVGLTENGAENPVLINNAGVLNTWQNQCNVNGSREYVNGKTRYYYNLDFYRVPNVSTYKSTLNLSAAIDSEGDLLCWTIYKDSATNIRSYFAQTVGITPNITGIIDLTGVSFYPVKAMWDNDTSINRATLNIENAEMTFGYEKINNLEEANNNKKLDDISLQHYQMQTGFLTDIITVATNNINYENVFNVDGLTLKGNFGAYTNSQGGVLICSSALGGNDTYKTIISLNGIVLDGIRCVDTKKPLLINSLDSYTSTSVVDLHTTAAYTTEGTEHAACSLIGAVGGENGTGVNVDFSDIGVDARVESASAKENGTYHTIFTEATFLKSFRYVDENSGGSYNFESTSDYVTYGKEISNTDSGRNNFNEGVTSQYCYFDTYGTDAYVVDEKGPGTDARPIAERFATGYLPYVYVSEKSEGIITYHELDINQRAYYLIDGCGTYGHPYQIKTVIDEGGNVLMTAANQMTAIRDILDGKGSGTVLCVNTQILKNKNDEADLHAAVNGSANDKLYIRIGNAWYHAVKDGNHYKKLDDADPISANDMLSYVRNAYFQICEDMTLDFTQFNGIGGKGVKNAFCGVIVGKRLSNGKFPTITLNCSNNKSARGNEIGGLIRYSQGSVVKDLNVVIDHVTLTAPEDARTPAFFGSVMGWIIGGDNIIDNVNVSVKAGGKLFIGGDSCWLTAIGGYVGYVGGNDCLLGGGIVFRNMTNQGISQVSYKVQPTDEEVNVDVTAETDGKNPASDRYYWNPYIGRVLEGYACAEANTCAGMGNNTDKNYMIPKIDLTDRFEIENLGYGAEHKRNDIPVKSRITIDSAQDLWVLSSIVNSGAGVRATNDSYKKSANSENMVNDAYYFGRVRTGNYENVGTTLWSVKDRRDENYTWGGIGNLWPEVTYLTDFTDNWFAAGFMAIDTGGRSLTMEQGDYDMTSYGNGFRGIGASLFTDGKTNSGYFAQKARVLRLIDQSIIGNNNVVKYQRHVYEYAVEPYSAPYQIGNTIYTDNAFRTRQIGLFNLYNQYVVNGEIKDLSIWMDITTNQTDMTVSLDKERMYTAAGGLYGRAVYNYSLTLTLNNVHILDGSRIDQVYYAGGILGRTSDHNTGTSPYIVKNCTVSGLNISNAYFEGGMAGLISTPVDFLDCSVSNASLSTRNAGTCYVGGFVGQAKHLFNAKNVTVDHLKMFTLKSTGNGSCLGGVVGLLTGNTKATFDGITVSNVKGVSKGYIAGIAGQLNANIPYYISDAEVKDCYLATTTNDRYAGGLVGQLNNGSLSGFNVRSDNNVIGYLITMNTKNPKQPVLDGNEVSITVNDKVDVDLLSISNIGLREKNNDNFYWKYEVLAEDSTKPLTNSHIGIWVGQTNNKDVKIVAASRVGEYSAVKSIGRNVTANSYVIYADYTGSAQADENGNAASYVNVSPDTGILLGSNKLTSDGASLSGTVAMGKLIIDDTLEQKYNKGYFGADDTKSMENFVASFKEDYNSLMSTYRTEENGTIYHGTDIPIFVLEMTSSAEINQLLQRYISVLTNLNQMTVPKYTSIKPFTYEYKNGSWSLAQEQTMVAQSGNLLKVRPGKYDNTKNQITIIDVTFPSPIAGSADEYHLYIPVLVKKVMDIDFAVKMVNGAVGFESAYVSNNATLASYGEDYTAKLTYTYTWTAEEWNSNIANGVDLLWSFDKQVCLDDLSALDLTKMRLTLVDTNTHGMQKSYFLSNGSILQTNGKVMFGDFTGYESMPICDLLPLKAEVGTEENPGALKIVASDDEKATLRRFDTTTQSYVYYALKDEENDSEETVYYNVTLTGKYQGEDQYSVKETYYLVMNCTEGQGMYNKQVTLGTNKLNGGVPSHVNESGDAIYVLGDFYNLKNMQLDTNSEAGTMVMHSGNNDYIDVDLSTDIMVNAESLKSYVINRPVYFRYAIHMTDENLNPVKIEAASTYVSSVMIGDLNIERVNNLEEASQGYVLENTGSVTYITIKALGSAYIGNSVTTSVRYIYDDGTSLMTQFPLRTRDTDVCGVKYRATSSMAYEYSSIGNTNMGTSRNDHKLYYTEETSYASLNYDSYNVTSIDGNTSQLGLNGRETANETMGIKSRALFDATAVAGLDRSDENSERYPYYLEGTLSLGKKTETDKPSPGVGKRYTDVPIQNFLSDFGITSSDAVVDTTSTGLGVQANGTYKFRIRLTSQQVENILTDRILINIDYNVKMNQVEDITGGQYANYMVSLSAVLKNSSLETITNEPSDYFIYTNAKVYLGIVGVTDLN